MSRYQPRSLAVGERPRFAKPIEPTTSRDSVRLYIIFGHRRTRRAHNTTEKLGQSVEGIQFHRCRPEQALLYKFTNGIERGNAR